MVILIDIYIGNKYIYRYIDTTPIIIFISDIHICSIEYIQIRYIDGTLTSLYVKDK